MRIASCRHGTHMPALMHALAHAPAGPVLELGIGMVSTPYLHWACQIAGRHLVSYENHPDWHRSFRSYQNAGHDLLLVPDFDAADLERPWAVALVDHAPAARRIVDVRRVASAARLIVLHDSEPDKESEYHYSRVYPLFSYRLDFTGDGPHTALVSSRWRF